MFVRIDRRRKLPVTILLRALGYDTEQILDLFFEDTDWEIKNAEFYMKLIPTRLRGEIAMFDIKDKKGEIIVENGRRITARHIRMMEKAKLTELLVPSEYLHGKCISKFNG